MPERRFDLENRLTAMAVAVCCLVDALPPTTLG
jgi:hypothetical protein